MHFIKDDYAIRIFKDIPSYASFMQQFLFRLLIDIPQLLLFVFYSLYVADTGLPYYGIISIIMNFITIVILLLRIVWHYCLFRRNDEFDYINTIN